MVTWFAQDTRNIPRILIVNTNAGQIKVAECNCYIEVAYCLDYLLMKCIQWFLNTYSFHYYPFRSHLPMHLFNNFIANTSRPRKYSISWIKVHENKAHGPIMDLIHMFQKDLFSSFWTAKPTTLRTYNISPSFNCNNICNLIVILLTTHAHLTQISIPCLRTLLLGFTLLTWHGMLSTATIYAAN